MQTDFKDLSRICNNIERVIRLIPHKAAVLAVNFSKELFVKKNWIDTSEKTWKKTKQRKGSTLIKSGRLKRSIRKVHIGADYAIIGTDVPYARVHNNGETIEGAEFVRAHERRAHKRKAYTRSGKRIKAAQVRSYAIKSYKRKYKRTFIQRRFLGESQHLTKQLGDMIETEIQKSFR